MPRPRSSAAARRTIKAEGPARRLTACIATARTGQRCKAAPMRGTKYCPLHTEGVASKLGERGGRRRAIFNPQNLEPMSTPQNAEDLSRLAMQTLVEVRAQRLDTKVATCIFYGIGTARVVLETVDLDSRLKALEDRHESVESARARVQ
jgi:hypothetical protein